jgi:hypothetical protein
MKPKYKTTLIWVFSVIFTLAFAYYQRKTGPTYPVTVKTEIRGETVKNRLLRTSEGSDDQTLKLRVPDTSMNGTFKYKRYKSYDEWSEVPMTREGEHLIAMIPGQPPAGKIEYFVFLEKNAQKFSLTDEPVIIRFKGKVPLWILIIHVIIIFTGMLFSTRTGLEAWFNRNHTRSYTIATFILLFLGGMILGPIIQKYAFGAFWTGWPLGHDLTDNKMAVAIIFWLLALIQQLRDKSKKSMVYAAAFVLILVFIIPHSTWGSEIDHTKM